MSERLAPARRRPQSARGRPGAGSPRAFAHAPVSARDSGGCSGRATVSRGRSARGGRPLPLRAVPSGGALYPLEPFVAVLRVAGLAPGLYHFDPPRRCWRRSRPGRPPPKRRPCRPTRRSSSSALLSCRSWPPSAGHGSSTVLRGYRFALLEAGHVARTSSSRRPRSGWARCRSAASTTGGRTCFSGSTASTSRRSTRSRSGGRVSFLGGAALGPASRRDAGSLPALGGGGRGSSALSAAALGRPRPASGSPSAAVAGVRGIRGARWRAVGLALSARGWARRPRSASSAGFAAAPGHARPSVGRASLHGLGFGAAFPSAPGLSPRSRAHGVYNLLVDLGGGREWAPEVRRPR